jgi:hypothetical protein
MRRVTNEAEFKEAIEHLFQHSSILLVQEYIPTEFDWRVGVLNGEPLFACKYYMAKGHWQIYNHAVTGKNLCGPWETVPIYQVPSKVLDLAVKASALIGKGLYGVDLKVVNGKPMVIEINDNPSIDHEVEDAVIGDELYYRILHYFVSKLNQMHAALRHRRLRAGKGFVTIEQPRDIGEVDFSKRAQQDSSAYKAHLRAPAAGKYCPSAKNCQADENPETQSQDAPAEMLQFLFPAPSQGFSRSAVLLPPSDGQVPPEYSKVLSCPIRTRP